MPQLNGWFDLYWNSTAGLSRSQAIVIRAVGHAPMVSARRRSRASSNDVTTHADLATRRAGGAPDVFGAPAFSIAIAQRTRFSFCPRRRASTFADSPNKIDPANFSLAVDDTLTHRFMQQLSDARADAVPFLALLHSRQGSDSNAWENCVPARRRRYGVVTNSLAVSDEPLVSVGLERHQIALLKLGVDLYELSSNRLKLDRTLKGLLGASTGRLHAKIGFLDRQTVLVGSMNLDPRSASINTEIGVRIESPKLAEMVLAAFKVDALAGVYQVRLRPNGAGVRWIAVDADSPEELDVDPDTSVWQRVRLMLLSFFIPESQL